jgi:hypothetical protein
MKSAIPGLAATLIFISMLMIGCDGTTKPEEVDPLADLKQRLAQSPYENEEAELMALFLSGEIVAPEALYIRLCDALTRLRGAYSDSIPCLDSISYRHKFHTSHIDLWMLDDAVERIRDGTYSDWDSLNVLYRVTSIDTSLLSLGQYHVVALAFEGRLNATLLKEYYEDLAGVYDVTRWSYLFPDGPNIYPWITDTGFTFLLRSTNAFCPSGCGLGHVWYFKELDQRPVLIGDHVQDGQTDWPDWWTEANDAYCTWFELPDCTGD